MGILTTISVVITLVLLIIVLLGGLVGFFRGWKRGTVGLGRRICAALLAFLTAKILSAALHPERLFSDVMDSLLTPNAGTTSVLDSLPTIKNFLSSIPAALVMPIVFAFLFVIFDLLLLIPAHFVKAAILRGKPAAEKEKTAEKVEDEDDWQIEINTPEQENGQPAEVAAELNAEQSAEQAPTEEVAPPPVAEVAESKAFDPVDRFCGMGATMLSVLIAVFTLLLPLTGLIYTMTDGIDGLAAAASDAEVSYAIEQPVTFKNADGETVSYSEINADALNTLSDTYVAPITGNIFFKMSYNPIGKAMYTNLTQISLDGKNCYLSDEIDQMYRLLSDCAYFFADFEDYGVKQEAAIKGVTGYVSESEFHCSVVAEVLSALADSWIENKSFAGISKPTEVANLSIVIDPMLEILAASSPDTVSDDFETLGNILAAVIKHDLHKDIADMVVSKNADNIIDILDDPDFVYEVLSHTYYNNNYRSMMRPIVHFGLVSALSTFGVENEMPQISDKAPEMDELELHEEADRIVSMMRNAKAFIDSMPASTAGMSVFDLVSSMEVEALGSFLNVSRESILLDDGGVEVFKAILRSSKFDSIRAIADILARHLDSDPDLNMVSLMKATKALVGIVGDYEDGGGTTDTSLLSSRLSELISSVDGTTAVIINEMLDSGALGSAFISGKAGDKVTSLMTTMITTMADMGELTPEELEKETKAVDYIMKIASLQSDSSGDTTTEIKTIFKGEGDNSEEMMEVLLSSKLTTASLQSVAYDENGNLTPDALNLAESVSETDKIEVIDSAREHYIANVNSENRDELQTNINAIAAIFGEDLSAEFALWDTAALS